MADFRQSKEWGKYLEDKGWLTDTVRAADGKHRLQVLIFRLGWWPWKMMKLQRNEYDPDFADLKRIRKKYHVIQTVIEPLKVQDEEAYKKAGFKRARAPFLALRTVVVDLTKTKRELWQELSENTRRLIKKNEKARVEKADTDLFHQLWKENSKIWVLTKKELNDLLRSFGKKAHLSMIKGKDGYHSGLIVLETADTADYFQTWTSDLGRKSGAHFKLVWEEILQAKKRGLKVFDFEGIYDPEYPIKKWLGFSEFKKKFGGEEVRHPGSFARWF